MFSSDKLLHLVFASQQDVYFYNELLRLDLPKYLWMKLHELGYGCVYFLEPRDGDLRVKTYGDSQAEAYAPNQGKKFLSIFKNNNGMRAWLLRQLTAREPRRSALIFDLKEFCEFFQNPGRQDLLRELAALDRRTGILILTAPPEAEGSKRYLLESPVFGLLGEWAISSLRTASPCDMYDAMHRNMGDRMVFLNAFTSERIHSILTRLLLEDPQKTGDYVLREEMEAYLLQWMNNPALRQAEQKGGLLLPSPEKSFRDVYSALREEAAWARLRGRAEQVSKVGSIEAYASALGCRCVGNPVNALCLRRDSESFAYRCVHLDLHGALRADSPETEAIAGLLEEIRNLAGKVQNREENPQLIVAIQQFLAELPAAEQGKDLGTLRRLLFSIRFCLQWLCIPRNSEEEANILSIVERLRDYITCSRQYWDTNRSYLLAHSYPSTGTKIMNTVILQKKRDLESARRLLASYEDVVQASVYNFSTNSTNDDISRLARNLSSELDKMNNQPLQEENMDVNWEPVAAATPPTEQPSEAEIDPDVEFVFDDEDMEFHPNSNRN